MRVEFRQGVPHDCINWLWDNLGSGNISPTISPRSKTGEDLVSHDWHAWKYERIAKPKTPEAFDDDPFEYVPTITVKDEKDALLFALRWA